MPSWGNSARPPCDGLSRGQASGGGCGGTPDACTFGGPVRVPAESNVLLESAELIALARQMLPKQAAPVSMNYHPLHPPDHQTASSLQPSVQSRLPGCPAPPTCSPSTPSRDQPAPATRGTFTVPAGLSGTWEPRHTDRIPWRHDRRGLCSDGETFGPLALWAPPALLPTGP